jgi:hypothetical protein
MSTSYLAYLAYVASAGNMSGIGPSTDPWDAELDALVADNLGEGPQELSARGRDLQRRLAA